MLQLTTYSQKLPWAEKYAKHYAYDAIGNLIQDAAEDINNIQWTVYGKVKKVDRGSGSPKHDITFSYGPDGQRISKTVFYDYTGVANDSTVTTYYVRDASGNIMATYRYTAYGLGGDEFYLGEQHIYGSSRIGYREISLDLQSAPVGGPSTAGVIYVERGRKRYEMSNHLGNVLSVISDRRKLFCDPPTGVGMDPTPGYYQADIIMATDYSSFGAPMVARNWNSAEYKYGFNGQLKDDEVYGAGNSYDFGARIYDPRIGRWLKCDPLFAKAPGITPYRFGLNNPLRYSDQEGNFEIDEATAKAYPKLDAFLQNISKLYADKPQEFKQLFKQYSELSDQQITDMLTYNKVADKTPILPNQANPRIVVAPTGAEGLRPGDNGLTPANPPPKGSDLFENKGSIVLNQAMVQMYELMSENGSPILKTSVQAWLESTIFHEATHYGDILSDGKFTQSSVVTFYANGLLNYEIGTLFEGGKNFETMAYGFDVGSGTDVLSKLSNTINAVKELNYDNAGDRQKTYDNPQNINLESLLKTPERNEKTE